jgi:hypothetical protein
MTDDRRVMYNRFSKKSGHSAEWVWIVKEFLNQAFAGCRHVAKCPCTICQNYRFLNQDEEQVHLCQEGFMPNYLVWRDHGEVEPPVKGAESDRNEEGHQCRGDLLQVLDTSRHCLDTGYQPRTRVRDIGCHQCVGTSSRRPADAVGNTVDAVRTSGRRFKSGMICIFSNYRLRIKKINIMQV